MSRSETSITQLVFGLITYAALLLVLVWMIGMMFRSGIKSGLDWKVHENPNHPTNQRSADRDTSIPTREL